MSGPQWGFLSLEKGAEVEGALPEIMWSPDSQFIAFVKLHIESVPNRQGAEGFSFRVCIMRLADHQLRYCLGNVKLAEVKLQYFTADAVSVLVNGQPKEVSLNSVQWSALHAEP